MKKLLVIFSPLIFIFMVACGGDDKPEAPPVNQTGQEHPDDHASRLDLQNKVAMAKQACGNYGQRIVITIAPVAYQNPGIPPQILMNQGPGAMAQQALAAERAQCEQAVKMAVLNCRTMQNGRYCERPDVSRWLWGNLAAIGDRIGASLPPEAMANPMFRSTMRGVGAQFALQVAQGIGVPQAIPMIQNAMLGF